VVVERIAKLVKDTVAKNYNAFFPPIQTNMNGGRHNSQQHSFNTSVKFNDRYDKNNRRHGNTRGNPSNSGYTAQQYISNNRENNNVYPGRPRLD